MVVLIAMLVANANGLNVPWLAWVIWGIDAAGRALDTLFKLEKLRTRGD